MTLPQETTNMLTTAHNYAQRGFHVLPLNGKRPRCANGSKDATAAAAQIERWWTMWPEADIGIATMRPLDESGDCLVVIDVDGDEGAANLIDLEREYGSLPYATTKVRTGRGGFHAYVRVRAGVTIRNAQAQRDGWENIDIRGVGGFVVAPPSVHQNGNRYEWIGGEAEIAYLPDAWVDALTAPKQSTGTLTLREGQMIPDGARNNELASWHGKYIGMGHTVEEAEMLTRNKNARDCANPLSDEELESTIFKSGKGWAARSAKSISESMSTEAEAASVLEGLDARLAESISAAFDDDVIAALCVAKDNDPGGFAVARAILKKRGILLDSINRVMAQHRTRQAPVVKPSEHFDDAPINLRDTKAWRVRENGIFKVSDDGIETNVLHAPLLLTKRLKEIDTTDEQVELAWLKDGVWNTTICSRLAISGSQQLVQLSERGLPVTSNSSSDVMKYIADMETANLDVIPLEKCTTRTGWLPGRKFYPGAADDIVFAPPGWAMTSMFNGSGTLDGWRDAVAPMRDRYLLVRLQLAGSFCAPLLEPLNARNFILHLWGSSLSGKTCTLRAAASVWGSRSMVISFSGTELGMQNHAAMLCDLPMCINERQSATRNVDKLLYALCEGTGRVQGAKQGGNRGYRQWRNPILTNGEEPLTSDSGMQGTRTRVLEVEGEPIDDEGAASDLYDAIEVHHGVAGPVFIAALCAMDKATIREDYRRISDLIVQHCPKHERTHIASMSVVALGDYYASMSVFGESEEEAFIQSVSMAMAVLDEHLGTAAQIDQSQRAYEWICDLVQSNLGIHVGISEDISPSYEQWGFVKDGRAWLLSTVLREKMESAGYSHRAILRMLGQKSLAVFKTNGRDRTFRIRRSGNGYNVINLPSKNGDCHEQHGIEEEHDKEHDKGFAPYSAIY